MRTRTRFAVLFACLGIAVMAVGVAAIYEAVGRYAGRRVPSEAETLLGAAARRAIDPGTEAAARLEDATESLIAARALLAETRVMGKDAVIRLALEVAAILGAVLAAAALAFYALSRLITKGLDELAAGAVVAQGDRTRRFARSSDPDLDAVASALNELLDLTAEQERRLHEAARLEGWREVASFLAHQLKNPLAAILLAAENGRLSLAEESGTSMPEPTRTSLARESLDIVRIEADRLRALIDRFRDLAPEGLGAYGSQSEFDLLGLLEDCAARAERSGASVTIAGPGTGDSGILLENQSIMVIADRGLLEQAFWNLFANSIEAAADSPPTVSIEARVSVDGERAVIAVGDSNRGIDPAIIPRLGVERVSTKAAGTGLGLMLVRRILAAQGGSLELSATIEGGLLARVALPRTRADSPSARSIRSPAPAGKEAT
jgi:signal transduction histidine kinase